MSVIPAVDLREGACVQLVGGSYDDERIRIADPEAVVASWFDRGFATVHVVDLDAATGRGTNTALVETLLARWPQRIQVGGGVRSTARVAELLDRGALRVIVGTRALDDPAWLVQSTARFPGRLVLALDIKAGTVVADGWRRGVAAPIGDLLADVAALDLGGLLVTAVHREGGLQGPDLDLMRELRGRTRHVMAAAGGIRNAADVDALSAAGIEHCVVGMAMYATTPDSWEALR